MFSDETQIKQFNPNKCNVHHPANERYNPKYMYIFPAVKSCPSIMVWGAITANGRAGVHLVPKGETIIAEKYLQIIEEKVPRWLQIRNCRIFMHDGAPCHQGKQVKAWLAEHDVNVLSPWPGSSSDLNPIENCWVEMKKAVSLKNPTSLEDLRRAILEVWCTKISAEYCTSLVDSMPRRIEAVLKAGGKHTKY